MVIAHDHNLDFFHAFRRFRTEVLRRSRVPEDLVKLWLGHSKVSITDFYADGLRHDTVWRSEWCQRAGLGFLSVPKNLAFLIPEILARPAMAGRARTLPVPPVGKPDGRREEDVRNAKATRSRDSVEGRSL